MKKNSIVLALMSLMLAVIMLAAGCGYEPMKMDEKVFGGTTSSLTMVVPFELKALSQNNTKQPNGSIINGFEGHNSDILIMVTALSYDKVTMEKQSGKAWSMDLDSDAKRVADNLKLKTKGSTYQLEDIAVAGMPGKKAVIDYTANDIDLQMRIICFAKGDELWTVSVSARRGNEDMDGEVNRIIDSIKVN